MQRSPGSEGRAIPEPQFVDVSSFDGLGDGLLILDRDGTCTFVNEAGARLFGRAAPDLVGRSLSEVLPDAVGSVIAERHRHAFDHGQIVELEHHVERLGRWYMIRAFPSTAGLAIHLQDSSPRHAADQAIDALLAQSRRQQRLATVLAETNEAVFRAHSPRALFDAAVHIAVVHGGFVMAWIGVADPQTGVIRALAWAGEGAQSYLDAVTVTVRDEPTGRGPGGVAMRTGAEVFSNDMLTDPEMAPWRDAAANVGYRSSGAFPLLVENRVAGLLSVYAPEPGYFNSEEVALVRRLAANVAYGWEALLRDAALRESEVARRTGQRFRAVLSAAPDAIIVVSPRGLIDMVNSQAERLFGWTAEELRGQHIAKLIPSALFDRHFDRRARDLAAGALPRLEGFELTCRRRDDSSFPAEIALSSVTDEDGHVMVLASARDITERLELEEERRKRALEAQREQSDRLEGLGKLAGGVAHDFNNLLGVILNYAALLEKQPSDPQARADLAEIRAAAERGAELTRHLLTFARRDPSNPEPVDVNGALRGLVAMLSRILGSGIEVSLRLDPVPLVTVIDRQQLDQVVLNLAINARDAMQDGGQLTISSAGAGPDAGTVVIRVSDTGAGMTPEVAARAFEPFFTTKPRGEGTGLGLATVYGIVNRAGGEVSIDSAPGTGTTVTVRLARADAAASAQPDKSRQPAEELPGGRERVLLVEDDPRLRDATRRIIESAGYQVAAAADGIEALELLDSFGGRVDLVLTDVMMPGMGGDELARLLAARVPPVKVLMMSGEHSGALPRGERLLLKPVTEASLLRVLRRELDA